MKRIGELSGSLTPEAVERGPSTYVNFLSDDESVADGSMGVVGYCFSGACDARRGGQTGPNRGCGLIPLGGRLFTDAPTSPHLLLLPRIKAELDSDTPSRIKACHLEAHRKPTTALQPDGEHQPESMTGP